MKDPLNGTTGPEAHWTTANIGEAMPGVLTPLSWSLWGPTTERTNRETFRATGAFTEKELPYPAPDPPDDRINKVFYGRAAVKVDALGDRMPGTSGQAVVAGVLGTVPDDMEFAKTRRRYAHIAASLAYQNATISKRLHVAAQATTPWWQRRVGEREQWDTPQAFGQVFIEPSNRFYHNVLLQTVALLCAVQPMYDAMTQLAARAGLADPIGLTSGYSGVPETAVITDIWRCSRGDLPMEAIVARYGHHGPREGELSGVVWREDDTPLRRMVDQYKSRPDEEDPVSQRSAAADKIWNDKCWRIFRATPDPRPEPFSTVPPESSHSAESPRAPSCKPSTLPGRQPARPVSCMRPTVRLINPAMYSS